MSRLTVEPEQPERETEDDMARRKLGPRGVPGGKDPSKMTPQQEEQTPKPLDPVTQLRQGNMPT